jgi:hypothetical protein
MSCRCSVMVWEASCRFLSRPSLRLVFGRSARYCSLDFNHFMIGRSPHKSSTVDQAAWRDASAFGWALKETAATGDFGIDAMAYHESLACCNKLWLLVRHEVASFMRLVAEFPSW